MRCENVNLWSSVALNSYEIKCWDAGYAQTASRLHSYVPAKQCPVASSHNTHAKPMVAGARERENLRERWCWCDGAPGGCGGRRCRLLRQPGGGEGDAGCARAWRGGGEQSEERREQDHGAWCSFCHASHVGGTRWIGGRSRRTLGSPASGSYREWGCGSTPTTTQRFTPAHRTSFREQHVCRSYRLSSRVLLSSIFSSNTNIIQCVLRRILLAQLFQPMAAVQTYHTMTLGRPQNTKMFNVIHSPNQQNCVIVSTGLTQSNNPSALSMAKSVIQGKRPLAPAPDKGILAQNNNNSTDVLRCKRKINFVPYGAGPHQPASVARRNARERNRVKQVNNGFATLRQHIPESVAAALAASGGNGNTSSSSSRGSSKKLSKVETLRMAVEYIRSLQRMLEDCEDSTAAGAAADMLGNRYYPTELGHQILTQQTPPCSEASSSPTPSFSSESSASAASTYAATALYHTENYENYEPTSPEDEELLDAISWWQQQ